MYVAVPELRVRAVFDEHSEVSVKDPVMCLAFK